MTSEAKHASEIHETLQWPEQKTIEAAGSMVTRIAVQGEEESWEVPVHTDSPAEQLEATPENS